MIESSLLREPESGQVKRGGKMNILLRFIEHPRQCFIGYPNTSNFVKNTPLRVVFPTFFSVFGYPDEALSLVFHILLLFLQSLKSYSLHSQPSIEPMACERIFHLLNPSV